MGRPRINPVEVKETIIEAVHKLETPKPCPKCDGVSTGAYKDKHGYFRCHCAEPRCGFWDSQVYHSMEQAVRGWNLAGGPARTEGY